jgi:hypothetical protein
MKLPIPADWNGEDWRCIQVQWPDSPYWLAMLNGWLSQFKRQRTWDETTGDIDAVKEIGWQIWLANMMLTSCDGTPTPPLPPEIIEQFTYLFAGDSEECEDEMSGCGSPTPPIKIEGGHLWYWSCCQWNDIGTLDGGGAAPPDDTTPTPPTPADLACRKAVAIVGYLFAMARDAAVQAQTLSPLSWFNLWSANYAQFKLDFPQSVQEVFNALMNAGIEQGQDWDSLITTDYQQTVICRFKDMLSSDTLAVTAAEANSLIGVLQGQGETQPAPDVLAALVQLLNTAGLTWIALDGEHNTAADCDCPQPVEPKPSDYWGGYDWKQDFDFATEATLPDGVYIQSGEGTYSPNVGIVSGTSTAYRRIKPGVIALSAGGRPLRIAFKIRCAPAGTTYDADPAVYYSGGTTIGMPPFPEAEPFTGATLWWETQFDWNTMPLGGTIYMDLPGYLNAQFNDINYNFRCTEIVIAGSGNNPFIA